MDYEKAYKEAIKRAKAMIEVAEKEEVYKSAITIFPELKESEDERMRNRIIDLVNARASDDDVKPMIAWLEKQKAIDVLDEEEREFADNIDSFRKEIDAAHQKGYNEGVRVTLEKQGEKNSIMNVPSREVILSIWDLGNEWEELTNGFFSTKYGTQLDYIQKHWYESEYYLKAKQGEQKLPIEKLPEEMKSIGESLGFTTQEECDKYNQMVTDIIMSDDKVEPKFMPGDWIISKYMHLVLQIINNDNGSYKTVETDGTERNDSYDFIERNFKLWTIQDAKDGDVLAESKGDVILMFRGIGNARWDDIIDYHFYYDCYRENFIVQEDVNYWGNTENNQLKPATKEQRDLLFQKMKDDGYEWDAEKLELKEIEQNPINKIEPKFHEGEWVVQENIGVYKVIEVCESWYEVIDNKDKHYSIGFDKEYMCHLWTIKDAKDGDVLAYNDGSLTIFHYRLSGLDAGLYMSHVLLIDKIELKQTCAINNVHPATKEQRDLLFSKMKESDYKWDAEKKELNKMHVIDEGKAEMDYCFTKMMNGERVSPAWSEEDERTYKSIMYSFAHNYPLTIQQQEFVKSLKHQNRWEPSEEQMKALHDLNLTGNISYAGQGQVLIELYNDLEELIK